MGDEDKFGKDWGRENSIKQRDIGPPSDGNCTCGQTNYKLIFNAFIEQHPKRTRAQSELHTAFSREQPDKKVYVTHLLKDHGEYIWRILGEENGHLYVCG
ncbi:hypothetical protein DAPPUDRAFT_346346, partial [Daphnia pulex]